MVIPGQLQGATILQVIPDLAAGGAERTTVEVAEAVAAAGGRALVASSGGRLEPELKAVGGELLRNETLPSKSPLTIRKNTKWLADIINAENVDIIHARSRAPAWSSYWASKKTGAHFVTTYHGVYNARSTIKRWYNSVMARGESVIANSSYTAAHVIAAYPDAAERITTIPRGVDLEEMTPEAVSNDRIAAIRKAWFNGSDPKGPIFLLPGRLTRWKGQEDAIDAFDLRKRRRAEPLGMLVLAGDDQGRTSYLDELQNKISDRQLDETVRIVGHCSDMAAAYLISDIVLAPSREPEAFGRVAAEAGAMGRRVIAADHGGQKEIVQHGETGLLAEPANPESLADAMTALSRQTAHERAAMEAGAQTRCRGQFSKQALQTATLNVYLQVLGRL